MTVLSPTVSYLTGLLSEKQSHYATILLKALGIAFLTHCAADLCKESGEVGLATGVESVGKLEILLLCLPLMEELLAVAKGLLSIGG